MSPSSASLPSSPSLWIFGYGSLIWNPGFSFIERRRAFAIGFARRMYQGNTFHRGDEKLPGRVATLVNRFNSLASGVVFRVAGYDNIDEALKHLQEREVGNGYEFRLVRVVMAEEADSDSEEESEREFLALTCIASAENSLYLGPAPPRDMAKQIGAAKGRAGPNHEYVLKLAEHIRALFPSEKDPHLFGLERRVLSILRSSG